MEQSLELELSHGLRLKLDRVSLVLLHWPHMASTSHPGAGPALFAVTRGQFPSPTVTVSLRPAIALPSGPQLDTE